MSAVARRNHLEPKAGGGDGMGRAGVFGAWSDSSVPAASRFGYARTRNFVIVGCGVCRPYAQGKELASTSLVNRCLRYSSVAAVMTGSSGDQLPLINIDGSVAATGCQ
jgi:hypothetical protein